VATIRFANGSIASLAQSDAGETPYVSKFSFQLADGRKTAHLRNRLKTVTLFDGETATEYEDPEEYGFLEENRDFVRALLGGVPPPITHHDGLRATMILLRAVESLKTGTAQPISW
jgi:predicted dehydrogenase